MDHHGRRGRRGRSQNQFYPPRSKSHLLEGAQKFIVMVLAICIVVMLMQYNCRNCASRHELIKLSSSVDEIAKKLNTIKNNYELLESKLATYSYELPKLEEQMAALGLLAHSIEVTGYGWNPRIHGSLPYVDVHLNNLDKIIQENQNTSVKNATKTTRPIRPVKVRGKKSVKNT